MTTIGCLFDADFNNLHIGQVVYQTETDILFIIIGLRASFPNSECAREDEIDLLSEKGKVSNIFHLWGEKFQLLASKIPYNQRTNYLAFLQTVRKSL